MQNFTERYDEYMQSPEWQRIRQLRIQIDGGKCAMCGKASDNLEVHHMRYNNLGCEDVWRDVVSLCAPCHEAVHALMNRATGRRADGTVIYGWCDVLPYHIRKALQKRGLM